MRDFMIVVHAKKSMLCLLMVCSIVQGVLFGALSSGLETIATASKTPLMNGGNAMQRIIAQHPYACTAAAALMVLLPYAVMGKMMYQNACTRRVPDMHPLHHQQPAQPIVPTVESGKDKVQIIGGAMGAGSEPPACCAALERERDELRGQLKTLTEESDRRVKRIKLISKQLFNQEPLDWAEDNTIKVAETTDDINELFRCIVALKVDLKTQTDSCNSAKGELVDLKKNIAGSRKDAPKAPEQTRIGTITFFYDNNGTMPPERLVRDAVQLYVDNIKDSRGALMNNPPFQCTLDDIVSILKKNTIWFHYETLGGARYLRIDVSDGVKKTYCCVTFPALFKYNTNDATILPLYGAFSYEVTVPKGVNIQEFLLNNYKETIAAKGRLALFNAETSMSLGGILDIASMLNGQKARQGAGAASAHNDDALVELIKRQAGNLYDNAKTPLQNLREIFKKDKEREIRLVELQAEQQQTKDKGGTRQAAPVGAIGDKREKNEQ